jgi:hypothetical protein
MSEKELLQLLEHQFKILKQIDLYEEDYKEQFSKKQIEEFRNEALDKINEIRRLLNIKKKKS